MSLPLYEVIAEKVIKDIKNYVYVDNQKLPSTRVLALKHNVSKFTVFKAIQHLEKLEYVYSIHGSGTFIKPKTVYINLDSIYSFDVESSKYDFLIDNKILELDLIMPDNFLKSKMKIKDEEVFRIVRLRSINGAPIMLQNHYLLKSRFPFFDIDVLETMPLYSYLKEFHDFVCEEALEFFQAVVPTSIEQDLLNLNNYSSCLRIQRVAKENEKIIEFSDSIIRGDKYAFEIKL